MVGTGGGGIINCIIIMINYMGTCINDTTVILRVALSACD